MNYFLNIGSNIGDRRDNLYRAVVAMAAGTGGCVTSGIVESEPWGYESANRFLNMGMWIGSGIPPLAMLDRIHDVERQLGSGNHRDDHGNYIDRLVDIDIMAIDDLVIDTPALQVPHPRMHLRDFFLRPMAELAPGWIHPITGLTAAQMLHDLETPRNG